MKHADVIIVGAGAAGLAATRVLSDRGCSVMILEARDRIGGRILTIHDPAFDVPVELGAEFIHGRPDVTLRLINEARLLAQDVPWQHRQRRGRRMPETSDFSGQISKVMRGLTQLGRKDISFAEYLKRHQAPELANARRLAIDFVEGFDAADPQRISAKALAEEQEGLADLDGQTQFRLLKGYGALIEYLRRSSRATIRLRTVVKEIRWRRGKVEVHCGRDRVYRSSRVIITLPLGVLQLPPEVSGGVRFVPEIGAKRQAAMKLASGPVVKAVLKFREPFWEKDLHDAVFLHDPSAPFPTWWTMRPTRTPILTAWAGGPKAIALSGLSQRELKKAALDSLRSLFHRRLDALVERFHIHDWPADPFSRGAYSYVTVGGSSAGAQLAKPIDSTLFFAGEATDTEGQASTVAGALASGERAAREILKSAD